MKWSKGSGEMENYMGRVQGSQRTEKNLNVSIGLRAKCKVTVNIIARKVALSAILKTIKRMAMERKSVI